MELNQRTDHFVSVNGIRLHYLDWGGDGPVLLFIPGLGCTAYIFADFAPRFTNQFHVLALTRRGHGDSDYPESGYDADTLTEDLRQFLDGLHIDQVILAGHSMAYVELSRFAELYPQRVLKLIYLDAVYERESAEFKDVHSRNPLPKLVPAWPEEGCRSIAETIATTRRLYPALDVIWGPLMDEEIRHTLKQTSEGKIEDRMSEAIGQALSNMMKTYQANYVAPQVPILSFFAIVDGRDYLSHAYMTEEQRAEVLDFVKTELQPYQQKNAERFGQKAPQARVITIPCGHHYCFIKQSELVYETMRNFLNS